MFGSPVGPDFVVTQPFGPTSFAGEPPKVVDGVSWPHWHSGVDFGNGRCGGDVVAAADGTVHYSARMSDGNNCITIAHGSGWMTLYGHLAALRVAPGAKVTKGQLIGFVGSTGNSTGCHLHFGTRADVTTYSYWQSGRDVDPLPMIGADMDLKNAIPIAVCDVAGGATVYADAAFTSPLIPSWVAVEGVGVYGQSSSGTCIRVDFSTGGKDLRGVWVKTSVVSNLRAPGIASPEVPGIADAISKAAAIAAIEAL